MRLCRAWGKDRHWFDRQSEEDRRAYAAEFMLSGMDGKARQKMVNRVGRRKFMDGLKKARRGDG